MNYQQNESCNFIIHMSSHFPFFLLDLDNWKKNNRKNKKLFKVRTKLFIHMNCQQNESQNFIIIKTKVFISYELSTK